MTTSVEHLALCDLCSRYTSDRSLISGGQFACDLCVSDLITCDHCGLPTRTVSLTDTDGDLCPRCTQSLDFYECDDCTTLIREGDVCSTHTALHEESFTCCECVDTFPSEVAHQATRDRQLCGRCARNFDRCDDCGLLDEYIATIDDDVFRGDLCRGCTEDRGFYECLNCETLIDTGSYCHYHDTDCDDLHDYGFKPDPIFHGIGPRYLGMELEINVPRGDLSERISDAVDALDELGYLKEDCSISYGFELVTHPMSYRWALESFPWHLLRQLQSTGCSGTGNGLHVHISRDAFTGPCHVFRWMKFIYRNAPDVQALARRHSDYAAFDDHERTKIKDSCKGNHYGLRNLAINTHPAATLELRIFASSLDTAQVQAALAFADASVRYTRDLTVPDIAQRGAWNWNSFTQWLLTHQQYLPLARELENLACAC